MFITGEDIFAFIVIGSVVMFTTMICLAVKLSNSSKTVEFETMEGQPNLRRVRSTLKGSEKQRALRIQQRAKDAELMTFVTNGNSQWARQHLQGAQQMDRQGMLEDISDSIMMGDQVDPFNF